MRKIILFDIDGTLVIDGKWRGFIYLARHISILKKKGIIFGINTNRPWSETVGIYKKLRLNGPVILENGAAYKLGENSPEILVNSRAKDLNKKIVQFLTEVSFRYFPDRSVIESDNKSLLKRKPLIFISKNRKYTSSIYVRSKNSVFKRDVNFITRILRMRFGGNKFFAVKKDPRSGKIIASDNFYDRIKTTRHIRNRYFLNCKFFIISDDEQVRFKDDINFCAVKNAAEKYKRNCHFVAKTSGRRGIKDLIHKIANQS